MRSKFPVLFLIATLLLVVRPAHAENTLRVEWSPNPAKQGEVCFIRAFGPVSLASIHGEFRGERFPMVLENNREAYSLLGIDLDTPPGAYQLKVFATGRDRRGYAGALGVRVAKADFGTQKLTLPPSMVDLDPKTLERVNREDRRLKDLFQKYRKERLWSGPFSRPLQGELSTAFGLRRIINGQPRSPHTGIDLAAEEGTPILACNSGAAVLVDQLFFTGQSVVLDHGWGLYSMYFHLSKALVREGERVQTGAVLGRVGATGRSTGPHLHWGVKINGARVDPLSLLRLNEHLRE